MCERVFDALGVLTPPGTAIYVFGSANCTYTVTLDNAPQTPAPEPDGRTLFATDQLPLADHYLSLTASPTNALQQLLLDRAVVSVAT